MVPLLYVGDVTIFQTGNTQAAAGEEIEVTIDINKEGVAGPARLKLDLSDAQGIEIKEIETEGASFSFNGTSALFIWYSIPSTDKIKIKYKIVTGVEVTGSKTITGVFSYLDEDVRKSKDIQAFTFSIAEGTTTTSNSESEVKEEEEEIVSSNNPNATTITDAKCDRTIEKQGDNYIVTVNIEKGLVGGFARIKEDIPSEFTAEKIETDGSVFKFSDNSAKFLWSQIPEDKEIITVKYKLIPTSAASGTVNIRGTFSAEFLVEDNKPKKIRIATSTIELEDNLASTTPKENKPPKETVKEVKKEKKQPASTPSESTTIGSTSTNGVKYRVQIIAAHNTVSKSYIKKYFGYSGAVNIDNHEGWTKYTTNGFNDYKEAKNNRNSLTSYKFDGPFVTAYNDGVRITVQEALMLSNQSWVQ